MADTGDMFGRGRGEIVNTFNIGDRVIVLEGSRPDFVGKVGEVISVERITGDRWYWKSSDQYLYGLMCDDGRPRNGFGVENLAITDILPPQATPQPQPATAPTAGGAGDVVGQTIYDAEAVISGYHFTFGNGEKHRELNLELKGFPPMVTQGETVTVVITRKQDATPQQADLATLRAENAKLVSELAAVVSACNHKAKVIDAILDRAQELDIPVYRSLRIVIQDLDDGYVQP